MDKTSLSAKVAKSSATLEEALRRGKLNAAVAAVRGIVQEAAQAAAGTGLDRSAQAFVASLLYPVWPDLAAKGLAAAGWPATPPAWPADAGPAADAELIELVVQINGKKQGSVRVTQDADEETVMAAIRSDRGLNARLGHRTIRKTIIVANRLVNLAV